MLELQYDGTELGSGFESSESRSINAQASLKGVSAGFNFEQTKGVAEDFAKEMGSQFENFFWVGGAHAGTSRESWSVGLDGVVPVFVDLRPIDELLLPPFVSDPAVSYELRPLLKAAVRKYLDNAAEVDRKREEEAKKQERHLFSITLNSVRVDAVGDELDGTFELAAPWRSARLNRARLSPAATGGCSIDRERSARKRRIRQSCRRSSLIGTRRGSSRRLSLSAML